jgi:structural maintenance of chromosome 2
MFKSIGLNIEHPETFFVQQGRITQIVSFKPLEIMEMLMESAGVALFHEIADNTHGVMKEKSEKLEVTQQRMKLNFGPRLKMMEKERAKLAEHESLQSQVNEKKAVQTRLIKYQAHKTLRFGWETLSKCEKSLEENQKLKEFFKSQLENLHRQNESESGETRGLTEDLMKLGSTVEGMRAAMHKSRLEREEKAREKKLKSEKVQALREKQAEKDKTIARSNTIKESMEALIGRLNERMDNIAEEKLQLGLRGELGDRSDDPAKPIENRIVKLKKEQARRKDDLESLKSQINMTYEHLKNNEKNKDKLEQDLGEAISEEKKLTSEVENLKQIVRQNNLGTKVG